MRRLLIALGTVALAALASLLMAAPALAGPPSGSLCPPNYQLLIVDDLTDQGYMVPALVDEEGNNNGLVCGDPFSRLQQRIFCFRAGGCHVPVIYNFRDDFVIP